MLRFVSATSITSVAVERSMLPVFPATGVALDLVEPPEQLRQQQERLDQPRAERESTDHSSEHVKAV
jgi:hypothetical protein